MSIYVGNSEPKEIYVGNTPVKEVYVGTTKVRPMGPDKDYLCFTAEQANSTVKLTKSGSPTAVILETSTDGINWNTYTFGNKITLTNVGDKVYWRNTSETATGFSIDTQYNRYYFTLSGKVAASGDINFLLCKNSTTTLISDCCFFSLFYNQYPLTAAPKMPATTITARCYGHMYYGCNYMTVLPKLPATTLKMYCYNGMFSSCSQIKLSTTKTGAYQTAYRIPDGGSGTSASSALSSMFSSTGGTFTGTPTINTTYYTSNTVV